VFQFTNSIETQSFTKMLKVLRFLIGHLMHIVKVLIIIIIIIIVTIFFLLVMFSSSSSQL